LASHPTGCNSLYIDAYLTTEHRENMEGHRESLRTCDDKTKQFLNSFFAKEMERGGLYYEPEMSSLLIGITMRKWVVAVVN
jgi:hypothetical protein